LINQQRIESNPYLKARGESQLRAKHAFERRAGWRFGLVFGIAVIVSGYVLDAIQLFQVRAEFWWAHLALACVTILPLALLAGGIGGYLNWLLKLVIWALFGVTAGWCAIHIPFDAARLVLQWFDPNLKQVEYLVIPTGAADSYGMLAALGACLGLLTGLMQTVIAGWAWERSTADLQFTLGSWATLLVGLPFALAYGLLFDGSAQAPLRAPLQTVHAIIQSGLNEQSDLDPSQAELHRALTYLVGQSIRAKITPEYTLYLAASEPKVKGETYVDASFRNGTNLRCRITTFGEFSGGCIDLNQTYANYMSEFLRRGTFDCQDCESVIAPQAAAWQKENARTLTRGDATMVAHGAGSSVNVRVNTTDGKTLECLLWGANPVTIAACQ
jgi:hypothetical protein